MTNMTICTYRYSYQLLAGMILALAVLSASGCKQTTQQAAPPPPMVTVANPERQNVQLYGEFTGTTKAVESVEVRARVSGVLQSVNFVPSSMVRAGQKLFVIEKEKYLADRDQARSAVKAAEADLDQAAADLRRIKQAIKTNAVSQQDLDKAQAVYKRAEAGLQSSKASLAQAELNYSYTDVTSPINGQVSRNFVDPGNLVGAGENTLLTRVENVSPIYVYFDVPERTVLAFRETLRKRNLELKPGAYGAESKIGSALIKLSNEKDFTHPGRIDFVDNRVNVSTGTIQMRVVSENKERVLLPGLFVNMRIFSEEIPDALVVDERAVGSDLGGKFVLIVGEGNIVEQRYLTLGAKQDNGTFLVEEGIDEDDRYIINGILKARPGLPVTPLTAAELEAQKARMTQGGGQP